MNQVAAEVQVGVGRQIPIQIDSSIRLNSSGIQHTVKISFKNFYGKRLGFSSQQPNIFIYLLMTDVAF